MQRLSKDQVLAFLKRSSAFIAVKWASFRANPPSWRRILQRLGYTSLGLGVCALAFVIWPLPAEEFQLSAVRSVRLLDRQGVLLYEARPDGAGLPILRHQVSPHVVNALLAIEDRRFYTHYGVDLGALVQSLFQNVREGDIVRGGSTLTMQVARMHRAAPRTGWRRWWNKIMEMLWAFRLELHLSKDEILMQWLNRAPFGNRTFGIASAARFYFGKSPADLNIGEAAYLVGLPQSPSQYNPFSRPERAQKRQQQVLKAMRDIGALPEAAYQDWRGLPVSVTRSEQVFQAPHFVHQILQQYGEALFAGKVDSVRTTLDLRIQKQAEQVVRSQMRRIGMANVTNAAVVVLENATGEVLAYVGSVDFWEEKTGGQNDGVQALRQPGSSLKPFTYAMALDSRRYTPASILADLPVQILEVGGGFSPENYDKQYHGPVSLRQALACSYNIPAVKMARELEPSALLQGFRKAGLSSLKKPAEFYGVGLTLGNGEVTLLELTRAYAGLARGGTLPPMPPFLYHQGQDQTRPANGISPQVSYLITHILSDPEARAPAFGRGNALELPFPVAAKTGTSKDYRDNWVVGYTPRYTVGVWAGNFDGSPMEYVSGISGAGPIFQEVMQVLGASGEFIVPQGIESQVVCTASGKRPNAYCPTTKREVFYMGTMPQDSCQVHQNIRINIETGELADAQTPKAFVREEVFTVHPPEFHAWMQENGLRLPPRNTELNIPIQNPHLQYSELLQVQYPASGTVYLLDPVLRADYQRIRLRGIVSGEFYNLRWAVDGVALNTPYQSTDWALQVGAHYISLQGVTKEGQMFSSVPVKIRVQAAGTE